MYPRQSGERLFVGEGLYAEMFFIVGERYFGGEIRIGGEYYPSGGVCVAVIVDANTVDYGERVEVGYIHCVACVFRTRAYIYNGEEQSQDNDSLFHCSIVACVGEDNMFFSICSRIASSSSRVSALSMAMRVGLNPGMLLNRGDAAR